MNARDAKAADARQRARALLLSESAFARCGEPVIDALIARSQSVGFNKGDTICRQGDPGDSMLVVLSGSAKVVSLNTDAREVGLGFVKAGGLVGEIAVIDGRERTASVVALEPVQAVRIQRRDLIAVLRDDADAMMCLLESVCGRLRATIGLVETLYLETEMRVAACLVRLVAEHGRQDEGGTAIDLAVTQRDLGAHLGLTRETVSRTLGKMREKQLIDLKGSRVLVLDLAGLQGLAG